MIDKERRSLENELPCCDFISLLKASRNSRSTRHVETLLSASIAFDIPVTKWSSPMMRGLSSGKRKQLSVGRIVALVIAAAAPLSAILGNLPLALSLGNGAGLPGVLLIATAVLLCFSIGYGAMSRHVVNTGAFYTYVGQGLGKPVAVGAALLAVLSYSALSIGLAGAFGYFTSLVLDAVGVHQSWVLYAAAGIFLTGLLGYRSVDLSAKVLTLLMIAEMAIVVIFDISVLAQRGMTALPSTSLEPGTVMSEGFGIAVMFAFTSFIGFESAALYGEEATDPTRSIPRATYLAVITIGLFYFVTAWITVGAIGVHATRNIASDQLGSLMIDLMATYTSTSLSHVMAVLLCTSLLASMLAVHNAASRYLFVLGREKLLPAPLGRFNRRHYSPSNASVIQTCVAFAAVAAFFNAGLDPYVNLATSMVGLSTLGILGLQALAAMAIFAYFCKHPTSGIARTRIAPAIGGAGIVVALALFVTDYASLVGTDNSVVNALPLVLGLTVVAGWFYGIWLRYRRPHIYAGLAAIKPRYSPPSVQPQPPNECSGYDPSRCCSSECPRVN
ncbi:APC family permease [Streptomyces collinus]|uniref:APC family permease n=1 Tax=Streptomyces collinus TaxID=42684 RepID=UPI0036CAF715